MSGRRCFDCGRTEDVRAYPVESYPKKWGPYLLCANCRVVIDEIEADIMRRREAKLLADGARWAMRRGEERGAMQVRCEGGILDGKMLDKAEPEATIHQSGMLLLRVHKPYPKRAGEKVDERLLTYWEDYTLHQTEEGPVYRCVAPFGGVTVGEVAVLPSEGGAYDVYADRGGKLRATREEAQG